MLTPTTGCNHKAKNNAFGKLPRWAAPGWAAVGMQNVGARSGRCSRRPTAAVGPGGGRGGLLFGGRGGIAARFVCSNNNARSCSWALLLPPARLREAQGAKPGGERAARCGAQARGLQRERWERGSRTSSGVSPTWKEPQALRGLLGQPKRFLAFELRCRAAALKKNKSHFLQHGSSCCSICCAGRGREGAQVPLRERRNRSRGRGLRAAKHNAAPRSRVKTLFPKTNPKKPKRRPVSNHYITVAAFSSS